MIELLDMFRMYSPPSSECSSYQSGDMRKYEHHFNYVPPKVDENEKEEELDLYIDELLENCCPECYISKKLPEIIADLRRENAEIQRTVCEKNGELSVAARKEEILRNRIVELETEVEELKLELAKTSLSNMTLQVETQMKIRVENN